VDNLGQDGMAKRHPPKDLDPLKIFIQANNFVLAHHVLVMQRTDWMQATAYAAMVVAAFASELYMKTLICLEGNQVPNSHDRKNLFEMISADRKARTEYHWDKVTLKNEHQLLAAERDLKSVIPRDLDTALLLGRDAFDSLRYVYEERQRTGGFHLGDLPACLREVIVEINPHWKDITTNPNVMSG
jgi:hypothetical protein